jgi:hypothetical protein
MHGEYLPLALKQSTFFQVPESLSQILKRSKISHLETYNFFALIHIYPNLSKASWRNNWGSHQIHTHGHREIFCRLVRFLLLLTGPGGNGKQSISMVTWEPRLKGTVSRDFSFQFFSHESPSPGPHTTKISKFRIFAIYNYMYYRPTPSGPIGASWQNSTL